MWERLIVLAYFLGGVGLLCGVAGVLALLGGINGDDDDDAPAPPVRPVDGSRSLDALRTGSRVVAVRGVRARNERVEHLADKLARRKADWCLCGTPNADDPLDLDALTATADRLKQSAQRCAPQDAAWTHNGSERLTQR